MPQLPSVPSMRQEIFRQKLSTETISVYLLCCGLADQQTTISTRNLADIWNASRELLFEGLNTLEDRGILRKVLSDMEDNHVYRLTDIAAWNTSDNPVRDLTAAQY